VNLLKSESAQTYAITTNPFYFYIDVGLYADRFASDLPSFVNAVNEIDIRSIEFHMNRDDFEKWIRSLGNYALASDISKIKKKGLKGEALRSSLRDKVNKRFER
jgi:hypothetical protein